MAEEPATRPPPALHAAGAPARTTWSNYPEPFASRVAGREKRPLGDLFGLRNFGVNLTTLAPGAQSALHHSHSRQDEFIYVLEGTPTLLIGDEEIELCPGMCAGFAAGKAPHHIVNRSSGPATFLEIGDRTQGDEVSYPEDDLVAVKTEQGWRFTRKDGAPFEQRDRDRQ